MNWKGFAVRIAMVAVALPLIGVLVFLLPWRTHLALNLLIAAVSVIGSLEVVGLLGARRIPVSRFLAPALAGSLPVAAYLQTAGIVPGVELHLLWTIAVAGIILVRAIIFQRAATLRGLLAYAGGSLLAVLYPAFFLSFVTRMTGLAEPSLAVAFFLCVIFGDDMLAYFAGQPLGPVHVPAPPRESQQERGRFRRRRCRRRHRGPALPLARRRVPHRGLWLDLAIAAAIGIVGIVGDLVESGLKRSAGVKDSGVIIPGRGGILDSVDSLALAAPLCFCLLLLVPAA